MTFLWDITKGSYEFTPKEDRIMRWLINVLIKECPKTCSFLTLLDLDKIKFFWAPYMSFNNGIMGAWCVTSPNRIYIKAPEIRTMATEPKNNQTRSGIIKDVHTYLTTASVLEVNVGVTFIHEFIHKLQFNTSPILYVVNRLVTLFVDHVPFIEQIGIEYDARVNSETEELQDFLYHFNNAVISYFAAINSKGPDDPKNWLYKVWDGRDGHTSSHTERYKQLTKEYFKLVNEDV